MIKLNPYLNFTSEAEEAFNFYKSIFGGEFTSVVRFKDKSMEGMKVSKEDENKIMHISLPIGNDLLMASDVPESMRFSVKPGSNNYISVHPTSKEEADRIFNSLSEGGSVEMPIEDQFWGDYYGSLEDKFGVRWMINYSAVEQNKS